MPNMPPSDANDYASAPTDYGPLTPQQAQNVADLAARRAEQRLYTAIGRSVFKKALLVLGAGGAAALAWMSDWIHFGHK